MILAPIFFGIAILYAAVGFGGGSSYIAVLALFDLPYELIPVLALICNLVVVSGGSFQFWKEGHFRWDLFWPYALSSVPFAFLGGRIPISEDLFFVLLGFCLLLVSLRLLIWDRFRAKEYLPQDPDKVKALGIGVVLGLLSGMVGIGGGIFLAPILLCLKWGKPKQIAATASFFILLNSLAGLSGQVVKLSNEIAPNDLVQYWYLFAAVLLGGQLGSRLGAGRFLSQLFIKDATAVLVLIVATRLLLNSVSKF